MLATKRLKYSLIKKQKQKNKTKQKKTKNKQTI